VSYTNHVGRVTLTSIRGEIIVVWSAFKPFAFARTKLPVIYHITEQNHEIFVANMVLYAINSGLILVIHDNMIIGTNHIVLACLCRHF
jgi:hypothetical protein